LRNLAGRRIARPSRLDRGALPLIAAIVREREDGEIEGKPRIAEQAGRQDIAALNGELVE